MRTIDTIVIGGGQAGLAASYCLGELGVDHVVLERGRIGERWRRERWDSLHMLTPRWQSRLPGWAYRGPHPDGYMAMPELIAYFEAYARSFAAPVHAGVTVEAIVPAAPGYRVHTDHGTWRARAVVIATGHCDVPAIPAFATALTAAVHQLAPARYRNPGALADGGVLVVGASASGVQIASELARAGRDVTLAVGTHLRLPRRHRGRDILWWLDAMGVLAETTDAVRDLEAARRQPSWQLAGMPDGMPDRAVDLPAVQAAGVRVVGRITGAADRAVGVAGDLPATVAAAEARLARLLARIDAFAAARGLPDHGPAATLAPFVPPPAPPTLDLGAERITTVIWATGYRRDYAWLRVPGAVARGELVHDHGVVAVPGLYALGLRFQRRRASSFLDGVGDDARAVACHLARHLGHRAAA